MAQFLEEVNSRRTFAIISHPDAGKTTLTEKLLLFGGAIQVAGAVKSNKIKLNTTSLIYDRKMKIAYYNNGGLVKDLEKEYDIESKKGVFKTRIQSVFFKENVKLNHEVSNI